MADGIPEIPATADELLARIDAGRDSTFRDDMLAIVRSVKETATYLERMLDEDEAVALLDAVSDLQVALEGGSDG